VRRFSVHRLGRVPYGPTHELQQRLQAARIQGEIGDTVLLLEHPPVLTLGRGAKTEHVLLSPDSLRARGFEVHEVGRGGDVTYHGPGQLVAYPIISLEPDRKDVRRYVWTLEEAMIRVARDYGLSAGRIDKLNGAWLDAESATPRKIGAVGVRISRWVTMHGLAFNVSTDLSHFDAIVPCGIGDKGVTSLSTELGRPVSMAEAETVLTQHLAELFDADIDLHDGLVELEAARRAPG
jgi:lipoyl(octanoyl) transferase